MKYLNYLIVVLLLVFATSCSKDEIITEYIAEIPIEELSIENGTYIIARVNNQQFNTYTPEFISSNIKNLNTTTAIRIKDSIVVDDLEYNRISDFWNIETEDRALYKSAGRIYATDKYRLDFNGKDSLNYITELKAHGKNVVKLIIKYPRENRQEYAFGYRADNTKYIEDFYSDTGFFSDEIYGSIDPFSYKSFLEGFIADAARHGVDLSNVDVEESKIVLEDNAFAPAWVYETFCNPNLSKVYVARNIWESTGHFDKTSLKVIIMWHEFGHDLLQMNHWPGGGNIMSSSSESDASSTVQCSTSPYSLNMNSTDECTDWERAVDDLFNHFKQSVDSGVRGQFMNECN